MNKQVKNIILNNIKEINPRGEYKLYCNKHLKYNVLKNKFETISKFVKMYESDIIITKDEYISGDYKTINIKIEGFASNLIDEVLFSKLEG